MQFDLDRSFEILERTPQVLRTLLSGLSKEWITANEGPDTFSPYDVIGHLIHGERTDWIARLEMILIHGESKTFERYDRFAMYEESKGKTLNQLLDELEQLRKRNIEIIRANHLSAQDLAKRGTHPSFGSVTLEQLLATWVVHDLAHTAQIARVMAKQYTDAVGPWQEYLSILKPRSA